MLTGVGNVVATAVQRRQGVMHISVLTGERCWESLLYVTFISCTLTTNVLYSFALRDMGWFCPNHDSGGQFCGCNFVSESNVLRAYCCLPDT